jgi:ABC-type dipeptide/oligopeptide/nickel transport system permease component
MLRFIAGRLAQMIPVLFGVSLVSFFAIHFVPGDPIQIMTMGRATPETVAKLHAELGLDRPVWEQYAIFLADALRGDFGRSIVQKAPIATLIADGLMVSLYLLVYGAVLSILLAVPLAMWAAVRRDRLADHGVRLIGMIGFAMPPFWIGLVLMVLFGLRLGWFPIRGFGEGALGHLYHMFLPALTMALFLAPVLIQSLRSAILDVLEADYIEVARAKGLSSRRILFKHVLRNAAIPVITVLAVNVGWLLSGSVIVEVVYTIHGLGAQLVRSVSFRDYPTVQGLALVFAVIVMGVNLLADIAYMLIDRRVAKA